jgi:hypothetical protein
MRQRSCDGVILVHYRHQTDTEVIDTPNTADHGGAHNTLEV